MQKLILVQGLPFSGKSKLTRWMAKELGYARLAADDYRKMLFDKRAPIPDDEERLV